MGTAAGVKEPWKAVREAYLIAGEEIRKAFQKAGEEMRKAAADAKREAQVRKAARNITCSSCGAHKPSRFQILSKAWKGTFLKIARVADYLSKIEKPKLSLSLDGTIKLGRPFNCTPNSSRLMPSLEMDPASVAGQWALIVRPSVLLNLGNSRSN